MSFIKRAEQRSIFANQSGVASIMVTMILMLVISLIVLSFALTARREDRAALDRQLSTSAYYAAESGINDAENIILTKLSADPTAQLVSATQCSDSTYWGVNLAGATAKVDSDNNVSYTCLLVNPAPQTLVYDPITTSQAKAVLVQNNDSTHNIDQINISWQNSATLSDTKVYDCGASKLPPRSGASGTWDKNCVAPVLQIDIVKAVPLDVNPADTVTVYLYPTSGSAVTTAALGSINGSIQHAGCQIAAADPTRPNLCNFSITGLTSTAYYLRIKPIYDDAQVVVTAQAAGSSAPLQLANDQAVIDSTGKAQDVLRRVQVRVPINSLDNNQFPDNALQSFDSQCKQFYYSPPTGQVPSPGLTIPGPDACTSGPAAGGGPGY